MTLGNRMTNLRKEKGMSLENLTEALEVSVDDLQEWEQGTKVPSRGDLLKLCGYFHTTMAYLEGREPECPVRQRHFSKREIIFILDGALFLLCFLLAPVFKWANFSVYGESFSDPLNILFYLACAIFAVQVGKIIYEKTKGTNNSAPYK